MAYYDDLGEMDPHRSSGWRRRVGQLFRFEVALANWDETEVERVLDLGCGTGELCRYLRTIGWEVDYLGVDRREAAVDRARRRHAGNFRVADFTEAALPSSARTLVVVVGGHVDGTVPEDRLGRLRSLLARAELLGGVGVSILVLDRDVLRRRPMFRLEEALFGATETELRDLGRDVFEAPTVSHLGLETDLAIFAGGTPGGAVTDRAELIERFLGRPFDVSTAERAWLWLECGYVDRASEALGGIAPGEETAESEVRLLRRRIEQRR